MSNPSFIGSVLGRMWLGLSLAVWAPFTLSGCRAETSEPAGATRAAEAGTSGANGFGDDSIAYFYSSGCPDCREVDALVLPVLAEMGWTVRKLDIEEPENLQRLLRVEKQHGVSFESLAPNMVWQGRVLAGLAGIRREFLGDDGGEGDPGARKEDAY